MTEELAMTVHARQLARQCRERMAAHKDLPVFKQQPEQQHAAIQSKAADSRADARGTAQPAR